MMLAVASTGAHAVLGVALLNEVQLALEAPVEEESFQTTSLLHEGFPKRSHVQLPQLLGMRIRRSTANALVWLGHHKHASPCFTNDMHLDLG